MPKNLLNNMLSIKNIQNISKIHNFSLDSTIDLDQYFQKGNLVEWFYISPNYDGSIIVVLIKQYKCFILLHYILEEQQYKLLHEQEHSSENSNAISNIILNTQGNLLLIEYKYQQYDYYSKRARSQKWARIYVETLDYSYYSQHLFMHITCKCYIQSISLDLAAVCLSNNKSSVLKNFIIKGNNKLIYKSLFQNSKSSFISKENNFIIIQSEYYLNIYSIRPSKLLQQLEIFDGFNKMKLDKELKLFVLSKRSLQIYDLQNNKNYRLANYIQLQIVSCIENFSVCQNTIFFFIQNRKGLYGSIFEINNGKLDNQEMIAMNTIKRFQNNLGFIAIQNNSFCVFKSN